MAHIRQSRPDSALGFQEKVLQSSAGVGTLEVPPPARRRQLMRRSHLPPFGGGLRCEEPFVGGLRCWSLLKGAQFSTCTRPFSDRCRVNMAHIRQSRPEYGLGLQINVLTTFSVCPCRYSGSPPPSAPAQAHAPQPSSTCTHPFSARCVKSLRSFCTELYPQRRLRSTDHCPLSSERGTHKTVKALAFRSKPLKKIEVFSPQLTAASPVAPAGGVPRS